MAKLTDILNGEAMVLDRETYAILVNLLSELNDKINNLEHRIEQLELNKSE